MLKKNEISIDKISKKDQVNKFRKIKRKNFEEYKTLQIKGLYNN